MKISSVDFPSELLGALRDRRLVIFAGAGVSMGKPAKLPDFKCLVSAISQGTGCQLRDEESEDQFLGRLEDDEIDVHAIAAEILQRNSCREIPRPTSLHIDLLRLHAQPEFVRLVTTNFDDLFEDAAAEHFDSAPEVFRAPALPLGWNFYGIVHLHGTSDRPESMVLTDGEFGRAYLVEGWARRFLVELFRRFSVLFVGYSHSDTIMHYLSRALPGRQSMTRFALVKNDEIEMSRWRRLGIVPVPYPKHPEDDHSALNEGVRALADYATRGLIGWRSEITKLAENPPPVDEEAASIIDDALQDPTRTRFFTRAATDAKWIEWLDRRNHFKPLFEGGELFEQDVELAQWLADSFARQHPTELVLLIARHNTQLHPNFWSRIAQIVSSQDDFPLSDKLLSQWVSLLLTTAAIPLHYVDLSRLAALCARRGLFAHLVEVFDALTAPRLTLNQASLLYTQQENTAPRLDILLTLMASSEHWIKRLWEEAIATHLEHIAQPLLARVTRRLSDRHQTYITWQHGSSNFDPENFRRHAIKPHEQDQFFRPVDVLVDAARDCLESLVSNLPNAVARWCDEFANAQAPLLRRLVLHGLSTRNDLTPDDKCEWLLRHMDIHDLPAHHEMFQIAHQIYRDLGDNQRRALIQTIRAYRYPRDEDADLRTARHHFDWLHWLHLADPDCALLAQELEDVTGEYPGFQPREHPNLTHWMGRLVRVDDETPWTVEELLMRPVAEWISDLLSYEPADPMASGRTGLLLCIEQAATQEFEWGLDLSDRLINAARWATDLWDALLRAWSKSELSDEQRQEVLGRLRATELHKAHVRSIARFLCAFTNPSPNLELNESIRLANQLATDLWDHLHGTEPDGTEFHDWLTRAINHPAGDLSQFWINSLWLSRNGQRHVHAAPNEPYRSALSRIVEDQSVIGTLGRCVLCRSLAFLLDADEPWTTEHLIPLFDVEYGLPDSTAAWCGFLYGNTTNPAIEALKPKFLTATSRLETDFQERGLAERFVEAYTYVVFFHVHDPLPDWIPALLRNVDADGRRTFAWNIGHYLRQLDDSQRVACWNRWLKQYWERRLQGVPNGLSSEEIDTMLSWLPYLDPIFSDAVDIAVRMPRVPLQDGFILDEIIEANAHKIHFEPVAKLLDYLRYCQLSPTVWRQAKDIIDQLLQSDIPKELQTSLREILAELGLD